MYEIFNSWYVHYWLNYLENSNCSFIWTYCNKLGTVIITSMYFQVEVLFGKYLKKQTLNLTSKRVVNL